MYFSGGVLLTFDGLAGSSPLTIITKDEFLKDPVLQKDIPKNPGGTLVVVDTKDKDPGNTKIETITVNEPKAPSLPDTSSISKPIQEKGASKTGIAGSPVNNWSHAEYFNFSKKMADFFDYNASPEDTELWMTRIGFWFGTNEADWAASLNEIEKRGGVYLGVAYGGQNLSRIARGKFEMGIIIDVNPVVTEIFMPIRAALISMSGSRAEYLALISGLEFTEEEIKELHDAALEEIHSIIIRRRKEITKEAIAKRMSLLWSKIESQFPEEIRDSAREFWNFYSPRGFGLEMMIVPMKTEGSWLSNEENFNRVKRMTVEGRILGVRGDWSSKEMIEKLKEELIRRNLKVSVVYLSNVAEDGTGIINIRKNILMLPLAEDAIRLENIFGRGTRIEYITAGSPAVAQSASSAVDHKFGIVDIRPFFTTEIQKNYWDKFVATAINFLLAHEESIKTSPRNREARNNEISLKYSLDNEIIKKSLHEVSEGMLNDGLGENIRYIRGEGFSLEAIRFIASNIPRLFPEFKNKRTELDILYEISAHPNVSIDNKIRVNLEKIVAYINRIFDSEDYNQIYDNLCEESGENNDIVIVLLKWLANATESNSNTDKQNRAKRFLTYFTHRMLVENKDLLEAYADFVFKNVKEAEVKVGKENVRVVPVLTGAEPLGQWLRLKAAKLGKTIDFKDLLLTSSMLNHLETYWDTDTPFLTTKSKDLLRGYLQINKIFYSSAKHLIFVDTGFAGSLNEFLKRMCSAEGISSNYLLMSHDGFQPWKKGLAIGLNEQKDWENLSLRLHQFAMILDDGFEHSIMSPMRFDENGQPADILSTPRPWFHNLVSREIESLASESNNAEVILSNNNKESEVLSGKGDGSNLPVAGPPAVAQTASSAVRTNRGGIDLSQIELTLKDEKFVSSLNPADLKILRAAKYLKEGWDSLSLLYVHEIILLFKDNLASDIQNKNLLSQVLRQLQFREFLDPQAIQFLKLIQSQRPLDEIKLAFYQ